MLSLTSLFETEKNKKTGAAPVWLLEIPFVAGTKWLSDRPINVTGANLSVATMVNSGPNPYTTFSGASPTGFHAESSGTGLVVAGTTDSIPFVSGKSYKITFTAELLSGAAPHYLGANEFGGGTGVGTTNMVVTIGLNTQTFVCTNTLTGVIEFFHNNAAGSYTISDFSICEVTVVQPWIAAWGSIDEDLSNQLTMPMVSDFSADIIIDPDASPNIDTLLWSEAIETLDCELYLWFEGLNAATDPPILRWTGNIIDFEKTNELLCRVDFVDQGVKLDKYPGRVLSLVDYPNASLDDIGYQMPILYGAAERVPALRMDVPKKTTLAESITDYATAFSLSEDISSNGKTIVIDGEEILVNSVSGKNVATCARGMNNTDTGDFALKYAPIADDFRGYVETASGDIYGLCYSYGVYKKTGGAGPWVSQGLSGKFGAGICVAPDGDIYVCAYGDDIYVQTGGSGTFNALGGTHRNWRDICAAPNGNIYACVELGDIYKQTNGAGAFNPLSQAALYWWGLAAAPNGDIYCCVYGGGDIYKQTAGAGAFNALSQTGRYWTAMCAAPNGDIYACTDQAPTGGDIYKLTAGTFVAQGQPLYLWEAMSAGPNGDIFAAADTYGLYTKKGGSKSHLIGAVVEIKEGEGTFLFADHPVKSIGNIYSISKDRAVTDITANCTKYTGQGGANDLAGYAGKAVITTTVNYLVGDNLLISGQGYQDDGSGTFTGSAAALIERPDFVFKHFLYTYAGLAVANFSTDAATPFIADSYKFSVVVNERKKLREWLAYMALQCRCWFRFSNSKAYLLYRPDSLSSDKTIAKFADNSDSTTTMRIKRSLLDEIINVIHLYYQRDWSKTAGNEAYQAVTRTADATSITAYGEKERAETFLFDFIRDATMAADLRDFYLARYKDRKKVVTGTLFLDNFELEFADAVTLTEAGAIVCEVRKVGITPGSATENDKIILEAREY